PVPRRPVPRSATRGRARRPPRAPAGRNRVPAHREPGRRRGLPAAALPDRPGRVRPLHGGPRLHRDRRRRGPREPLGGTAMIKQTLWGTYLVAAMATTPFSGHEEPVDGPLLRLRWEAEAAREGLQVVCGEVRNDGTRAAQHVRLLVEQLDGGGRVMASRELEVL